MKVRIPTEQEFNAFKGAHCHQLWLRVGSDWVCPCCHRNKFQILRWTKRNPGKPSQFYDWMATLHEHHDHSVGWNYKRPARFQNKIICGQCNSADGVAKRQLKLPTDFSFSPQEISRFVIAIPHGRHKIDKELAAEVYRGIF